MSRRFLRFRLRWANDVKRHNDIDHSQESPTPAQNKREHLKFEHSSDQSVTAHFQENPSQQHVDGSSRLTVGIWEQV